MTIANKVHPSDIEQITYENQAEAKRVLLMGKTTSGAYLPFQVDSDGVIQVA